MKTIFLSSIFLALNLYSSGQNGLGYYTDINNQFVVFEKGKTFPLERTKVDSIHLGDDYISYIDAIGNLKYFSKGELKVLEETYPSAIYSLSNALVYKMQQRLVIYEKGIKKELTNWAGFVKVHQEIVVWQNMPSMDLMAYVNGQVYTIEKAVEFKTIKEYKIGRNIFAYNDLNNHLKIFFNGEVYDTQTSNILTFKCGKNTAAYYDEFYHEFKVFQNGIFTTLCTYQPKQYDVADDMVAYLDINEYFNVFYNGTKTKLLSYKPNSFKAINNMLLFYDFGDIGNMGNYREFDIFYKGVVYKLEKFIPKKEALVGFNSLLYFDNNGRIKYFNEGEVNENFIIEKPNKVYLDRDLPFFKYANFSIAFYYNKKLYEYSGVKRNIEH